MNLGVVERVAVLFVPFHTFFKLCKQRHITCSRSGARGKCFRQTETVRWMTTKRTICDTKGEAINGQEAKQQHGFHWLTCVRTVDIIINAHYGRRARRVAFRRVVEGQTSGCGVEHKDSGNEGRM